MKSLIDSTIVFGDPMDKNTTHGPLVDKIQFDRVSGYIQKGINEGAKLEYKGKSSTVLNPNGFYIPLTLFSNVTDEMTIAKEEIFGPVNNHYIIH